MELFGGRVVEAYNQADTRVRKLQAEAEKPSTTTT